MTQKHSIQICMNINSENISDDDKFEAIETVLNSNNPEWHLSKPIMIKAMRYLLNQTQK